MKFLKYLAIWKICWMKDFEQLNDNEWLKEKTEG